VKIVVVSFQDPTAYGQWATLDEMDELKCKVCYASGFLLEEGDFVKVGLLCGADKASTSNWIAIPKGCVLHCDEIGEFGVGGEDD